MNTLIIFLGLVNLAVSCNTSTGCGCACAAAGACNCCVPSWKTPCYTASDEASCKTQSGANWCGSSPPPSGMAYGEWVLPTSWGGQQSFAGIGLTYGVCFYGNNDFETAYSTDCSPTGDAYKKIAGVSKKLFSVGGAPGKAMWTENTLDTLDAWVCKSGTMYGYQGISYDVEEAADISTSRWQQSFTNVKHCKGTNFIVHVTTCHSSPCTMPNANTWTPFLLHAQNVDILSPQLYGCGSVNYSPTYGASTGWADWAQASVPVMPAVEATDLTNYKAQVDAVTSWATSKGYNNFKATGFFAWPASCNAEREVTSVPSQTALQMTRFLVPVVAIVGMLAFLMVTLKGAKTVDYGSVDDVEDVHIAY